MHCGERSIDNAKIYPTIFRRMCNTRLLGKMSLVNHSDITHTGMIRPNTVFTKLRCGYYGTLVVRGRKQGGWGRAWDSVSDVVK